MSENSTVVPESQIPQHLAENYDAIVADPERRLTYKQLAKQAKAQNDPQLAAWARARAAAGGRDITPTNATPAPPEKRDYNELTVEELKAIVVERDGIDASELKLKADYVAALELFDEQQADK